MRSHKRPSSRRTPNHPLAPPLRQFYRGERIIRGAVEPCEQRWYDRGRKERRRATVGNLGGGAAKLRKDRARVAAQFGERRPQPRRIAAGFHLRARDTMAL